MALRPDQIQGILRLYKIYLRKGKSVKQACEELGFLYDRSPSYIQTLCARLLADTSDVAQQYIRSNALRLAMRVVRDGNVQQSMDILERSNVGVLAPKKGSGDGSGSRGFFLTVSSDSCGAMKATAGYIEKGESDATPGSEISGEDDQLWEESQTRLRGEQRSGSEEFEDGGDTHPRGVQAGPEHQENEGLQVLDGEFAETGRVPDRPDYKDALGRRSFAKTPEGRAVGSLHAQKPRGPGKSRAYQEAVEKVRMRLAASREV